METRQLANTSRLISNMTGYEVPPNKAVVGRNAFLHESGIHQDGVFKDRRTFEIMTPKDIGLEGTNIFLGKHSGRHALKEALEELGYTLEGEVLQAGLRALQGDRRPQEECHRRGPGSDSRRRGGLVRGRFVLESFRVVRRRDARAGPP